MNQLQIRILVRGGVVQEVYASNIIAPVKVQIIDCDGTDERADQMAALADKTISDPAWTEIGGA